MKQQKADYFSIITSVVTWTQMSAITQEHRRLPTIKIKGYFHARDNLKHWNQYLVVYFHQWNGWTFFFFFFKTSGCFQARSVTTLLHWNNSSIRKNVINISIPSKKLQTQYGYIFERTIYLVLLQETARKWEKLVAAHITVPHSNVAL